MPRTGGPEGTLARRHGIGHNLPQEAREALADAVLQPGGRGT